MAERYCTMPKIPFFRNWYEKKFGDLCKIHDEDYEAAETLYDKYKADWKFTEEIAHRGYFMLSVLSLLAVNLPWVGKRFK